MEELFKTPKWDNRDEDVFFDLIDNQPTAYDPDKVIEQLGKHSFEWDNALDYIETLVAMDIVKKGGQ